MTSYNSDFTFLPTLAVWGPGLSTDSTTVTITLNYWWSVNGSPTTLIGVSSVSNSFTLTILPLAKLVAQCYTNNAMTVASAVANQSYTVGGAVLTIAPPTFTLGNPTTNLYSNTNFPISYL